ncbi:MAG: hypothetical protein KDK91_33735 [Gammaproteobacteria bacterium]|nr:hypothetical protein [Gammaproteobacteria bacterium]
MPPIATSQQDDPYSWAAEYRGYAAPFCRWALDPHRLLALWASDLDAQQCGQRPGLVLADPSVPESTPYLLDGALTHRLLDLAAPTPLRHAPRVLPTQQVCALLSPSFMPPHASGPAPAPADLLGVIEKAGWVLFLPHPTPLETLRLESLARELQRAATRRQPIAWVARSVLEAALVAETLRMCGLRALAPEAAPRQWSGGGSMFLIQSCPGVAAPHCEDGAAWARLDAAWAFFSDLLSDQDAHRIGTAEAPGRIHLLGPWTIQLASGLIEELPGPDLLELLGGEGLLDPIPVARHAAPHVRNTYPGAEAPLIQRLYWALDVSNDIEGI